MRIYAEAPENESYALVALVDLGNGGRLVHAHVKITPGSSIPWTGGIVCKYLVESPRVARIGEPRSVEELLGNTAHDILPFFHW